MNKYHPNPSYIGGEGFRTASLGRYWQTFRFNSKIFGLKIENRGTAAKPSLKIDIFSKSKLSTKELEEIRSELAYRLEADKNLNEFQQLAKKDKRFYPVFKKWLGMRNYTRDNLYELLIIGIVLQNATVRRSQQMLDALLGSFGLPVEFDLKKLYAFWRPQDLTKVTEEKLRALKLGYRAKFIKRLSQDFIMRKVDEIKLRDLDKESAQKELIKLYGVGPETARILLFGVLHHYDVFDHIAPWQQKIYSRLFYNRKLVPTDRIRKNILSRYGKYAMLAVHYIWEDVFWRRKNEHIPWLEKEIRL